METLVWNTLSEDAKRQALSRSPLVGDDSLATSVSDILCNVKRRGDSTLIEYAARFDKAEIDTLALSADEIAAACERVSPELKDAINAARTNIARFHSAQQFSEISLETQPGVRCELKSEAIEKVGL